MFVAIDFETANSARSSACSLGIVRVEGGAIVDRQYFLIRPTPNLFNPFNVRIHGITARDVAGSPEFRELWPRIAPLLEGQLVLAHNAAFDLGVLQQALDQAGLSYPTLHYACTVTLSRLAWRNLPRYNLKTVASSIGYDFNHHHALADAEACARIALQACNEVGVESVHQLLAAHERAADLLHDGCAHPPLDPLPAPNPWNARTKGARQDELKPRVQSFDPAHPLFGQRVVFTGELRGLDRVAAMQLVVDVGGSYANSVNRKTNVLVVAESEGGRLPNGAPNNKLRTATELIDQGFPLRILREADFFRLF